MNRLPDLLFYRENLNDYLRGNLQHAVQIVNNIPEQQFIDSDDTDIETHVYSQTEVLPIELHESEKEMEQQETRIDVSQDRHRNIYNRTEPFYVPGICITVSIPFIGDSRLWNCQPKTFNYNPPRAHIRSVGGSDEQGILEIVIERPMDMASDGEQFKSEVNSVLSNINWYLQQVNSQVLGHKQELLDTIKNAIANRRQRLGKRTEIAKVMNIPLKRNEGSPVITHLPIKRRILKPLQPRKNMPPELAISEEEYEYILRIIRHVGSTFETTPKTYSVHDEEELRDIILAYLNGYYEGRATGETFRKLGKTDIRIEDDKRAAFVGECKFWNGQKELSNAIDQLLSYLTWRDCKAALIIFNKNVSGFSAIQKNIPDIIKSHPHYVLPVRIDQTEEWRFRAKSADDPERLITIHVFLFNIYVKGGTI